MPLSGDALGIICESSATGLRGFTQDTAFASKISARRGCIEYTCADMGRWRALSYPRAPTTLEAGVRQTVAWLEKYGVRLVSDEFRSH